MTLLPMLETGIRMNLVIRGRRGILIVDPQGYGDVVMSIPLLKAVCQWARGRWPVRALFQSEAHFDLVREENLDLQPLFVKPRYQNWRGLVRLWSDLRGTTDFVISPPEVAPRKLVTLKLGLGAKYLVGEAFPPYDRWFTFFVQASWTKSMLEAQSRIVASLGINNFPESPAITVTGEESNWAEAVLLRAGLRGSRHLVGLHASAVVPEKSWAPERFGQVLCGLAQRFPGLGVISFGTAGERVHSERARTMIPSVKWLEGTGTWTIRQSLAVLSQCDLLLSGDTGLMHMAAAVGCRTLSIFGSTSPERRAPSYSGGLALFPDAPCHPCYRGRFMNCDCIRLVSPQPVLVAAVECLGNRGPMIVPEVRRCATNV